MSEAGKKTPYSNTGSGCTTPKSLTACVDWFSVTFRRIFSWSEISELFQINPKNFIQMDSGMNGYKSAVQYGDIVILYDGTEEMGTHMMMSGQGCRQYENLFEGFDWSDIFGMILNYDFNVSRLDLAIDDFTGLLNLSTLSGKARNGHVVSTLASLVDIEKIRLSDGASKGRTLYFGSGKIKIRFYDKKEERLAKGYDLADDLKVWNRYELQLRNEKATDAMRVLAFDNFNLGEFIRGIYKAVINFKVPSKTDSNKRRWKNCKWWDDFLGDVSAIKFRQQAPDPTILRSKTWVDRQVSGTLGMLNQAFGNEFLIKYLSAKGAQKISDAQQQMADIFNHDDLAKRQIYTDILEDLGENEFLKILHEIPNAQKKEIVRIMGIRDL